MKQIALNIISIYQKIISPVLKQLFGIKASCRFSPTCSVFAKNAIEKYGAIPGMYKALKRILSCQSFIKWNFKLGIPR